MSSIRSNYDLTSYCGLPLVRRAYKGLVVGLAVFILVLVILREPFRGYLAEVRISGPGTEGLDLDEASGWLREVDPHSAVVAVPAGEVSPRCQIRVTHLANRPAAAMKRLDELAARWLCQYLPDRLQAFRRTALADLRTAVSTAREREDAARQQVEERRARQLADMLQPVVEEHSRELPAEGPSVILAPPVVEKPTAPSPLQTRLETLRLELSRLLASFTEEHPQVVTIRSQIAELERQLEAEERHLPPVSTGPELIPGPALIPQAVSNERAAETASEHFVSTRSLKSSTPEKPGADFTTALKELNDASRARQQAEHRLSDRMQELGGGPTAADWTVEPAHVVTRLGGTPRFVTLAFAGLLATLTTAFTFRASSVLVAAPRIKTTAELATLLELPVVGNATAARTSTVPIENDGRSTLYLRLITHAGELVLVLAVLACLLSIALEPSLAAQVIADPLGTLSEVIGRITTG
jgi:hypothetical protein